MRLFTVLISVTTIRHNLCHPLNLQKTPMGNNIELHLHLVVCLAVTWQSHQQPEPESFCLLFCTAVLHFSDLQALEDCGVLSQVKRIGGSSVGAICAGLIAVGCSPQEIADVFSPNVKWLFQGNCMFSWFPVVHALCNSISPPRTNGYYLWPPCCLGGARTFTLRFPFLDHKFNVHVVLGKSTLIAILSV